MTPDSDRELIRRGLKPGDDGREALGHLWGRYEGRIRAFVRKPGGGEEMQFFEPGSYRPVY